MKVGIIEFDGWKTKDLIGDEIIGVNRSDIIIKKKMRKGIVGITLRNESNLSTNEGKRDIVSDSIQD